MDQSGNIAAAAKSKFAQDSFKAAVPGGLLYGIEKAGTAYPYASLLITLGETERQTGIIYTQDYEVHIDVFATQSVANAQSLQTLLDGMWGRYDKLPGLVKAFTLQIVLNPAPIDEDAERYQGSNVLIAKVSYTITLQEQFSS